MMEYSCFDFHFLGHDKKVSSLEDFIHFVDAKFNFMSFSNVLLLCARDIVTGMDYLHQKNDVIHLRYTRKFIAIK